MAVEGIITDGIGSAPGSITPFILSGLTANLTDYPLESDVRAGVIYKLGTMTGTLVVSGGGGPVVGSRIIRGLGAV